MQPLVERHDRSHQIFLGPDVLDIPAPREAPRLYQVSEVRVFFVRHTAPDGRVAALQDGEAISPVAHRERCRGAHLTRPDMWRRLTSTPREYRTVFPQIPPKSARHNTHRGGLSRPADLLHDRETRPQDAGPVDV